MYPLVTSRNFIVNERDGGPREYIVWYVTRSCACFLFLVLSMATFRRYLYGTDVNLRSTGFAFHRIVYESGVKFDPLFVGTSIYGIQRYHCFYICTILRRCDNITAKAMALENGVLSFETIHGCMQSGCLRT